ncbi:growth arrest-specific protein 1 [Manis pentadactyla]|uniref:growth arrest-specific protein 1 n=1 Tax=Manis pentadactyla TaxID=143292 RepID=UPI00255C3770|nr:growth arrest-specific protein 1 [Manis pentadactyla]
MHNEGAPRHHAGAPGPLLYLKPSCERVRSQVQRIRSPGSLSPEKPSPREAREPLSSRAEVLPSAPPGKGSPELGRGRGRRGRRGRGRGLPGRGKAGSARTRARKRRDARARGGGGGCGSSGAALSPEERAAAAAQRICRRGARCNRGAARSCSPAAALRPAAPRGGSERLPPPPGADWRRPPLLCISRKPPQPECQPTFCKQRDTSERRAWIYENTHARSWQDWGKLFHRLRVRRCPRLVSFPLLARRPPLPAMVAGLLGGGGWARGGTVPGSWLCLMALLQLLGSAPRGSGLAHGRRLICWQALLQCQGEPECSYAYSQYAEACAPVLAQPGGGDAPGAAAATFPAAAASFSSRWRCPSHCISALIQLNHTRRGPALEDCDCAQDENCKSTKRAIEPCLPRTSSGGAGGPGAGGVMGCTEARRRCDRDSRCNLALSRYLTYCGKLFNGLLCTDECRTVIEDMLAVPKAALLNDCVCDGLERPICESVKENMARLCFGAELGNGPGSSGSDGGLDDYYDEDYDDEQRAGGAGGEQPLDDDDGVPHPPRPGGGAAAAGGRGDLPYGPGRRSSGGGLAAPRGAWIPLASILLLLLPGLF